MLRVDAKKIIGRVRSPVDVEAVGRRLADEILSHDDLREVEVDLRGLPAGLLISAFFRSFLQRFDDASSAKYKAARGFKWLADHDFQLKNVELAIKSFLPAIRIAPPPTSSLPPPPKLLDDRLTWHVWELTHYVTGAKALVCACMDGHYGRARGLGRDFSHGSTEEVAVRFLTMGTEFGATPIVQTGRTVSVGEMRQLELDEVPKWTPDDLFVDFPDAAGGLGRKLRQS